jgi:hypothetical protein
MAKEKRDQVLRTIAQLDGLFAADDCSPADADDTMTATIIRLERFNVGCRHYANGIRFPHIYRVTGFEFDLMDGKFVPGTTPVETFYTLSAEGDFGVANPEIVPIKAMLPRS